jgi:hypothetical protein
VILEKLNKTKVTEYSIVLFHAFVFVYLTTRYYVDEILSGGNIWTTADWIVSYRFGFVRRGAVGSLIDLLSGSLNGASLLNFVFVIQSFFVAIYFFLLCRIMLSRIKLGTTLIAILISPIYISFWVVNPLSYPRKEILGLLTVAYAANCVIRRNVSPKSFIFTLVIWVLAILSHEAALLIGPVLLMFTHYQFKEGLIDKHSLQLRLTTLVLVPLFLVSILINFKWLSKDFCAYITNRDLSETFCLEGGIAWAMHPEWYSNYMRQAHTAFEFYLPETIIFFLFIILPIWLIGNRRSFYLTFSLTLASAPLMLTSYDWGRWLFIIGNSVIIYVLATNHIKISIERKLLLFLLLPSYLFVQLPFCCSVSFVGGLFEYFISVLRLNIS